MYVREGAKIGLYFWKEAREESRMSGKCKCSFVSLGASIAKNSRGYLHVPRLPGEIPTPVRKCRTLKFWLAVSRSPANGRLARCRFLRHTNYSCFPILAPTARIGLVHRFKQGVSRGDGFLKLLPELNSSAQLSVQLHPEIISR